MPANATGHSVLSRRDSELISSQVAALLAERETAERGEQLLRFVQSRTSWRRRSIPERGAGLGRIGGPVLTVAVMGSGGLPDERRVDGV